MVKKCFIAISLPKEESDFFEVVKKELYIKKQTNTPAHITLIPPIEVVDESDLINKLMALADNEIVFEILFDKSGEFRQARYVTFYLKPTKDKAIVNFQKRLAEAVDYKNTREYIAHLTLANRVSYEDEDEVKNKLKLMNLSVKIKMESIDIYKMNKENQWELFRRVKITKRLE